MRSVFVLGERAGAWVEALSAVAGVPGVGRAHAPADATQPSRTAPVLVWAAEDAVLAAACEAARRDRGLPRAVSVAVTADASLADAAWRAGADVVVSPWAVAEAVERAAGTGLCFELSTEPFFLADRGGILRQANPALVALGGRPGRAFGELVHPDDAPAAAAAFEAAFRAAHGPPGGEPQPGAPPVAVECRCRTSTGEVRLYRWTLHAGRGTCIGLGRDLTEPLALQAEVRQAREAAERAHADLEKFAHIASHDLQEPLRMVSSYVKLLERRYKGKLDEQADKFIHFAVDGAQRMQALVNDLLTWSRVASHGMPLVPVRAGDVAARVVEELGPVLAEAGAEVTVGELPVVLADAGQLRQVLTNLLGNAVKFRRVGEPPRISLTAARPVATSSGENLWRFTVRDNGIGIDRAHYERIFELFQRLHGRGEYLGSGVGLAIVKRIVERHGGQVDVESEPGQGTALHFVLKGVTP